MGFSAKQPIVGAEPLLNGLEIRLDRGQRILQFELGVEQALFIKRPRQLACTLYQLLQPAARAFDAGRRSAVIPGDGGQVMGLIQYIDALIGGRQDDAPPMVRSESSRAWFTTSTSALSISLRAR